jgi:hypothetical protein
MQQARLAHSRLCRNINGAKLATRLFERPFQNVQLALSADKKG